MEYRLGHYCHFIIAIRTAIKWEHKQFILKCFHCGRKCSTRHHRAQVAHTIQYKCKIRVAKLFKARTCSEYPSVDKDEAIFIRNLSVNKILPITYSFFFTINFPSSSLTLEFFSLFSYCSCKFNNFVVSFSSVALKEAVKFKKVLISRAMNYRSVYSAISSTFLGK